MNNDEKILLVDDEPLVLTALHRGLSTDFNVEKAGGPEEALRMLADRGPFAVVVSDFKMPGMDGVQFLARIKHSFPDTVRIMLTGQADLNAAMSAVNEGYVFRFLTKPCPATTLSRTLDAGLAQYRLITAERELLRCTLMGSVTVLTEILSAVYPEAFSRSFRIKRYVMLLAEAFGMLDDWQLEAAGILSQIGCVTLPLPQTAPSHSLDLLEDNAHLFSYHPQAAANFLRRIPRLEITAEIVALQLKPYREYDPEVEGVDGHLIAVGGQILHVAVDLERLIRRGFQFDAAVEEMRAWQGEYDPALLDALEVAGEPSSQLTPAALAVVDLDTTMVAGENICARNGRVLVAQGEQLTFPLLERLRTHAAAVGIVEPIQVLVPRGMTFHQAGGAPAHQLQHVGQ